MWDLDSAVKFLRKLEAVIEPSGYHCGLHGGVLYKGTSEKDLDVIIYPHDKGGETIDRQAVWVIIKKFCAAEATGSCGGLSQLRDAKEVRWLSARGKRVDFFFLE